MSVQSEISVSVFVELNFKVRFNFCARLCFNGIWFAKCMKIRKLKIEIMSIWHNSLTQCTVEFIH